MDNEKIVELLIELKTDVASIKAKMENVPNTYFCQDHSKIFADHEKRIRGLETIKNKLLGAFFLANFLTGIVVLIISKILLR